MYVCMYVCIYECVCVRAYVHMIGINIFSAFTECCL